MLELIRSHSVLSPHWAWTVAELTDFLNKLNERNGTWMTHVLFLYMFTPITCSFRILQKLFLLKQLSQRVSTSEKIFTLLIVSLKFEQDFLFGKTAIVNLQLRLFFLCVGNFTSDSNSCMWFYDRLTSLN